MIQTIGTIVLSLVVDLFVIGCGSHGERTSTQSGREQATSVNDDCWVPRPERVPNDELYIFANRLMEEDSFTLKIAEDNEASALRTLWGTVPVEMKSAVDDSISNLIKVLSHVVVKTREAELEHQRHLAIQKFYEGYTETFLSKYDNLYRREIVETTCRPLPLTTEKQIVSEAQRGASREASHAGNLERNHLDRLGDDCYRGVEQAAHGELATIQELALEAAQIGAQKRGVNMETVNCIDFARSIEYAVEAKYERARLEMISVLASGADRMNERAALESIFIKSAAHLYAMDKVITEVQSREFDIYRIDMHPTMSRVLDLVHGIRGERYREDSKEYLYLKRAIEFHQEIESLLETPAALGAQKQSDTEKRLLQLEHYISVLENVAFQHAAQNTLASEFAPQEEGTIASTIEEKPFGLDEESSSLDDFICSELPNGLISFFERSEETHRKRLVKVGNSESVGCRYASFEPLFNDYKTNAPDILFYDDPYPFFLDSMINGYNRYSEEPKDDCPEGFPILSSLPRWTSYYELPEHIVDDLKYGTVEDGYKLLRNAVRRSGLQERVYQFGQRGLALITQLERIEDNGRYFPSEERWNISAIPGTENWGSWDRYFRKRTGRYRFFILLLTEPDDFHHTGHDANWKEALEISNGCAGMPSEKHLAKSFDGLKVAIVVYEYYRPDEHSEPQFVERRLTGIRHVIGARMWMENELEQPIDLHELIASRNRSK